jgi:phage terminase large subunit-like protein
LTSSLLSVPTGAQHPRVESVPPYVSSSGVEAVELCAAFGIHLDPWQQIVLEGALGEDAAGNWSAFEVGVVVPRQNGKGEILLARQLAGLFLLGEQLIMHSAHEYKTAAEAFLRIKNVIENSDELRKACKRPRTSHGEEGIELLNGNRLRFVARSKGSGRGFSGDCVILDEAYELGPEQMAAMLPTLSARPNPQLWYASSAGMESSSQLQQVRARGIKGDSPGLAYFEWSADPRAEPDDREAWAQANPALGIRISETFIERERDAMPDVEFKRERLGIWDDAATSAVIPFDVWNEEIDRTSQPLDPVTFAVDIAPDRSASSIGLAGRRADGLWHVELVKNALGTAWIVDDLISMRRWSQLPVRIDRGSAAASLVPTLLEAGVEVQTIGTTEYAQACGGFYDAAIAGRVRHIDQTPLTAAVQGARKRPLLDAWAWNRKDATTDITPLVACTLALHGHAETVAVRPSSPGRGRVVALD